MTTTARTLYYVAESARNMLDTPAYCPIVKYTGTRIAASLAGFVIHFPELAAVPIDWPAAYTALGESLIPDIDRPAATAAVKRAHAAYLHTCANVRTLWNSLLSWPRPESAASDYETACAHSEDARAATLDAIRNAKHHPKTAQPA